MLFIAWIPGNYANYDSTKPATSILRQTSFNAQPAAQKTGPENFQAALRFAVHEVTGAEKGGQWLLSTFAPFKEKPAFPGFEDHSQEEIRFAYYEAVRSGTVEQYVSKALFGVEKKRLFWCFRSNTCNSCTKQRC